MNDTRSHWNQTWFENLLRTTDIEVFESLHKIVATCKHEKVPMEKSAYGPEMLKLGRCPDCGASLRELD